MRILHIIDNLTLGGAETLLFSVIKKMPRFEHHIILLTPQVHIRDIQNHAEIHCIEHTGWQHTFRSRSRIRQLVRKLDPAVIHSHLFLASFLTRLSINKRSNFIYSLHNLYGATIFRTPLFRLFERAVYRKRHQLIAVSEYVLNDYKRVVTKCHLGHVLYNFVDDSFFRTTTVKKQKQFPVKWIAVGSLKDQKNYGAIISCMKKLYSFNKNISLDVYGDGPLRGELEKQIVDLPFISLKGKAHNLSQLMDQYDAFLSVSKYEGYGIAPMEALARQLPLFLSDIPVYREIYKGHAFFVKLCETMEDDFVNAYQEYSYLHETEKEARATKGYKYANEVANSKMYMNRLLKIYGLSLT